MIRIIRQRRGSNNKRQGKQRRIKSKRAITLIQEVTTMLITITVTFKTTTEVKAYNLLSSASCSFIILL